MKEVCCYKDNRDNSSGIYTQDGEALTIGQVTDLINYLLKENEKLNEKLNKEGGE